MIRKNIYKKSIIILILTVILYFFMKSDVPFVPIEELGLSAEGGVDIISSRSGDKEYMIPIPIYNYGTEPHSSIVEVGAGKTIGQSREDRQLKTNKVLLFGTEGAIVISEDAAKYGMSNYIDALLENPTVNDNILTCISKGKNIDTFNHNIPGYASPADYIKGMLENLAEYNFFSSNYRIRDMYVEVISEGKNLVLPYIEIEDNKLKITGMALFKKDKMIRKLDMDDTKNMNMLRGNNVKGVLTISKNMKEYVDYYGTSKRKVTCEKVGDKYIFTINLSIKGEVFNNTLYKNLYTDPLVAKKFEKDMKEQAEKLAYDFISKMKNEYKIDCLELGNAAVAKYGRNTGTNWDEVVSRSDIRVNIDVKLTKLLRGNYQINN
jgi:Ger(x)C family germination protein